MLYYNPGTGNTYSSAALKGLTGLDDEVVGVEAINFSGFYPVQETTPTIDATLYNLVQTWSIVALTPNGEGAERTWTGIPKTVGEARTAGASSVKEHSRNVVSSIEESTGFTLGMLSGVAAQAEVDRPVRYSEVLSDLATRADVLDGQLTYIENATSVDDINAVVNPPAVTGSVDLNRTGNDLDDSLVTAITGVSANDLSLYFNSTGASVAYDSGNSKFPATVGVFSGNDYTGSIKYLGIFNLATFDLAISPATVAINWEYQK